MPPYTEITGLAGVASIVAAAFLLLARLLPGTARLKTSHPAMSLAALFVLSLVPLGALPLASYVRGVTGDLSITTLVMLWLVLLRPRGGAAKDENRLALLILIVLAAIALYPMALGAGKYDPYRLGYGDPQFVVALLLVALAAWACKFTLIALCIAFATFAWAVGWYESNNLWDYLLDPWVSVYASFATILHGMEVLLRPDKTDEARY